MRSPTRLLAAAAPSGLPAVRGIVRSRLAGVFGPPPFDPDADPGDPGLFGPGSASWRIVAEPAAIVGGVRALLVQLLHPLAMAGVAQHSRFRDAPLERLRNTSAYVTATTFGSTREALAMARRVRAAHAPVRGTAPDGRPYRAAEPHLLAWVSVSLTSSFLATDRAYAPRPADQRDADAFVAEQARAAALLDPRVDLGALSRDADAQRALRAGTLPLPMIDDGTLPTTAAALEDTLRDFHPELSVTAEGREAFRFLLWPAIPPAVRAGYLPLLTGAIATLDPVQRRLLGLPASTLPYLPALAQTRALVSLLRVAAGTSQAGRLATVRTEARPQQHPTAG